MAFADIIGARGMEATEATAKEVEEQDELGCRRLAVDFNQTSVGRLRVLIDELNAH